MKRVLSLIILLFITSCKKSEHIPPVTKVPESVTDSLPNADQDNQNDTLINRTFSGDLVLNEILIFVDKMEHQGWRSDTLRLKKLHQYKYLSTDSIHYINNYPFYEIAFDDTRINIDINDDDRVFMQQAQSIMGYFYYSNKKSDFISDGIIEQWEFTDEQQAKKALNIIRDYGVNIYFNTNPFVCRVKNYLIIFYTRAMAFSYDQKNVFKEFIKENEIKEPDFYKGPYGI